MKEHITNYTLLTLGVLFITIPVNTVIVPHQIIAGGLAGLTTIITSYWAINPVLFIFGVNFILLILAFIFISKKFALNTIVGGNILFPLFLAIIPVQAISDDLLLSAIFGGFLTGIGVYFLSRTSSSTGGTTIIGKFISTYSPLSFSISILIADSVIIALGFFAFGLEKTLYALVFIGIMALVADFLETGAQKAKVIHIICDDETKIREVILNEKKRGLSIIDIKGGYNHNDKKLLICIVRVRQVYSLKKAINQADPNSFVYTVTASSTYGGFNLFTDFGK